MSVLAFATGVSGIVQKESTQTGTTTSDYISDYVNEGLTYNGMSEFPIQTSNSTLVFGDRLDDIWVSDTIRFPSSGTWGSDDPLKIFVVTASGDVIDDNFCFGLVNGGNNVLNFSWYNGTEETILVEDIADTYGITLASTTTRFDIKMTYGTSGGFELYVDRQLLYSVTLDTTAMGRTPNKIRLGSTRYFSNIYTYHSSIMVADEDTTQLTMVQYTLDGDGSFTDFTHDYSYLSAFGETGDNYAVESSAAGDVSTYTFASRSSEISGGTVVGLGLYCRAKTQEAVSADQFRFVTYDGTDTAYSDYIAMDEYITPYQAILTTNPAGDAWTLDDIATHEFGFEVSENG
jgi:hypothetical protein